MSASINNIHSIKIIVIVVVEKMILLYELSIDW